MKSPVSLFLGLALATVTAAGAPAQEERSALAGGGRDLALKICSNCHVVAKDQSSAPILSPPAPSFAVIASRSDATEERLRDFLAKPHGSRRLNSKMPSFLLAKSQIDQLLAYLLSLKAGSSR